MPINFQSILQGLGRFGAGGQEPGFQGLLQNPLLAIGLQLLNREQSSAEAFANALQAGQQTSLFNRQAQEQEERTQYKKKKVQLAEQGLLEEKETKGALKKLFGNTKLSPEQLSEQLFATGNPELINLAIKIRPKPEVVSEITPFQRESLDLKKQALALRRQGGGRAIPTRERRLTRDERLAQELQGIDLSGKTEEEQNAILADIGEKTGRLDLIAKGIRKEGKKETKADTLSKDLVLYNKIFTSDAGGPTNRLTGNPGISQREFIARADVLRSLQKQNPTRNLSDFETLQFFGGTPEEFEAITNSFDETKAAPISEAPIQPEAAPTSPQENAEKFEIAKQSFIADIKSGKMTREDAENRLAILAKQLGIR